MVRVTVSCGNDLMTEVGDIIIYYVLPSAGDG